MYWKEVFLPKWKEFMDRMTTWDKDLKEHLPPGGNRVIVWFHDESVFYAHDHRKRVGTTKMPVLNYAKGEGVSLMVADFVSANFGWFTSPDGNKSACCLFRPGANQDGYFTNEEIIEQVDKAIKILHEYYPGSDFDHVFIYDNAMTHLERAKDALSARKMPKNTPKPGKKLGGQGIQTQSGYWKACISYRSVDKIEILMHDGHFENGKPQSLYFPMDHMDKNLQGILKKCQSYVWNAKALNENLKQ